MATPPQNNDNIRINAPLNFRHTDTLITTKVPHYPTKVDTGMSIIPGWTRPNANGQNANINDKDYNGPNFKARPLKHWRKQLRVYNYNGAANNSRTASISELERPGTTVYHFTPDCTCVAGEGGNSYIISNNQFGYETKDDDYTKATDTKIQNNGYTVVPYYATAEQISDPSYPAYRILTGVYNTNCINCSPQGNLIRSGIAFQSQAFYSYSNDKLESRCQTYEQNISTNKALGCVYFDAQGIPLWPNDTPTGPQVVAPVNYGSTIDTGTFFNLYEYGYNLSTLGSASQVNSASFTPKVTCNPKYVIAGFYVNIAPAALIEATIYNSSNSFICKSRNTQYSYINTNPPFVPSSFNLAARIFYFPETTFIDPSTSYYITFKTINSINFAGLLDNFITNNLSGVLVAEPLRCLSQTIYKPSNVAFAKQGAVAGATRLKKLVSDTITMNGSSFYSAKGAEEANVGRYQGTNISSNYYVKIKPVIDSCRGTIPTPPVLSVVDNDTYSITFTWQTSENSVCKIIYYTIIYYAINIVETFRDIDNSQYFFNTSEGVEGVEGVEDIPDFLDDNYNEIDFYNNNTETMVTSTKNGIVNNTPIYTDRDNSIRYNIISEIRRISLAPNTTNPPNIQSISQITSLNSNTYYLMSMTATNGNGTSFLSNVVLSTTLMDSNIQINIEPNDTGYTYPYNSINPTKMMVQFTSLNLGKPIFCTIYEATNQNVVAINRLEYGNTYEVTLNNAGSFYLYATQERGDGLFVNYGNSVKKSPLITVTKGTPELAERWDITLEDLFVGNTYRIIPPVFNYPNPVPSDILITYRIDITNNDANSAVSSSNIVTFNVGNSITINAIAQFRIIATTTETQNFRSVSITSENELSTNSRTPAIFFRIKNPDDNDGFINQITYGDEYTLYEAEFIYPQPVITITGPTTLVVTQAPTTLDRVISLQVNIKQYNKFIPNAVLYIRYESKRNIFKVISKTINVVDPLDPNSIRYVIYISLIYTGAYEDITITNRTIEITDDIIHELFSPPGVNIIYTIPEEFNSIATINESKQVTIRRAGTFTIRATTNETYNFDSTYTEAQVTVNRATPRIEFLDNIFSDDNVLIVGYTYSFTPPTIHLPPSVPFETIPITYTSDPVGVVTITNTSVQVHKVQPFRIKAQTSETQNFNSASGISEEINITSLNRPYIYFPSDFVTLLTYGFKETGRNVTNIYRLKEAIFSYPYPENLPTDLTISYSIPESNIAKIIPVESLIESGSYIYQQTVYDIEIFRAGTFTIKATTSTTSTFESITIDKNVIINKAVPTFVEPWDAIGGALILGRPSIFKEPQLNFPSPLSESFPLDILPFSYEISNINIASISGTTVTPLNMGPFYIIAKTQSNDRYESATIKSSYEHNTDENTPVIVFRDLNEEDSIDTIVYNEEPYFIKEAIFDYPYQPHELTITYSIDPRYSNIATLSTSGNTNIVDIKRVGNFNVQAVTNATSFFRSVSISYTVNVQRGEPIIQFPIDVFPTDTILFVRNKYYFNPPKVVHPLLELNIDSILPFTYTIEPLDAATINSNDPNNPYAVINRRADNFKIIAKTSKYSENFKSSTAKSNSKTSTTFGKPVISFTHPNNPDSFITNTTYGVEYIFRGAVFIYPEPILANNYGLFITYSIVEVEGNNVASIVNNSQVVIHKSGKFKIKGTTNAIGTFVVESETSEIVTVQRGTLIFNPIWNAFSDTTIFIINESMTFNAPTVMIPPPSSTDFSEIISIKYSYRRVGLNGGSISIPNKVERNITLNKVGLFLLVATSKKNDKYNSSKIESSTYKILFPVTPRLTFFPPPSYTSITFGDTYTVRAANIDYPVGINIAINYTIPTRYSNIATMDINKNIMIRRAGIFGILATSVQTIIGSTIYLPSETYFKVTVNKANPTLLSPWTTGGPFSSGITPFIVNVPIPNIFFPYTTYAGVVFPVIRYRITSVNNTNTIGTINNGNNTIPVTINRIGNFTITAETEESDNYLPFTVSRTISLPFQLVINSLGTISYPHATINGNILFINENVRGTGSEWFAVVSNILVSEIRAYVLTNTSSLFTPPGQTRPVPFNNIVTTLITNMTFMFSNATNFNQRIDSWDLTNVTVTAFMFNNASSFNQPIGNWNTSRVVNMTGMFLGATAFNQPINNWNTSLVTNMNEMFADAASFNQPINTNGIAWNTSSVQNMASMFHGASAFNQPIGNWNTIRVENMGSLFRGAVVFNQNINSWNTSSVTTMIFMFGGARAFNEPIGNWNTSNVRDMSFMFQNATAFNQLIWQNGTAWNTSRVQNMSNMFQNATAYNQIIFNWQTSQVTNMNSMFAGAVNFNQNIWGWNTGNVRNMGSMFAGASRFRQDINSWNTAQVTNMSSMFQDAISFNFPIDNWITNSVTDMSSMFRGARSFNHIINTRTTATGIVMWNTSRVTNMSNMFNGAIIFNQPIGNWNTGQVTNMSNMFNSAIIFNQPIGNWNTANVRDMSFMFTGATAFNQNIISTWFTGSVTNMSHMFYIATAFNNANSLTRISGSWNTANVTNMASMFNAASNFNSNIGFWNTSNVRDMSNMFAAASVFNQPIGNWNTANVRYMNQMFEQAFAFNQPIGNWNVSNVQFMFSMFNRATAFNQFIGNWNTSSIQHISTMFGGATAFNQNISRWNIPFFADFVHFRFGSSLSNANTPPVIVRAGW